MLSVLRSSAHFSSSMSKSAKCRAVASPQAQISKFFSELKPDPAAVNDPMNAALFPDADDSDEAILVLSYEGVSLGV